jgi:hypothetical protein
MAAAPSLGNAFAKSLKERNMPNTDAFDQVSDELLEWAGWWAHFLGIQVKSARGMTC